MLCTFCLRPSISSIAIGLAVNFASGSSEKFDNFGKIPIAKPFFGTSRASTIFEFIVWSEIIILEVHNFLYSFQDDLNPQ